MKKLFKGILILSAAMLITACGGEKFNVEGQISGAADSTLYFENMSLKGVVALDSVKLGEDGRFAFSAQSPEAPDFYRLRIAGQVINISIDSTETVKVNADCATMATDYTVEGSDNCQRIKELSVKQIALQRRVMAIENAQMDINQKRDSILAVIREYKNEVISDYIFVDPRLSSSYFALFQTVGRYLIFDPYVNRDDRKAFAAVATCWDAYYHDSERSKNLYNITMQGISNERQALAEQARVEQIASDSTKIEQTGIIDIALPDIDRHTRRLSELKGKVVMLDFHMYGLEVSPARIIMMRELYTKYHNRGFEIYQIGLDQNAHFWSQQVEQLPWICVRDEQGISSVNLAVHNVQALPDYFLIDRNSNLVKRMSQVENLEKEIEKLLAK